MTRIRFNCRRAVSTHSPVALAGRLVAVAAVILFAASQSNAAVAQAEPAPAGPTLTLPTTAPAITLATPTPALSNPALPNPTLPNPAISNPALSNPASLTPAALNPALTAPATPVAPLSTGADSLPPLPALPSANGPTVSSTSTATPNDVGIPPNQFGHLGVTVLPVGNGDGLRVVGIQETSPAFPAGLLIDDEITAINGKRISKFEDLVAGLRTAAQGDGNVSLLVRRRGTLDTINLMVGGVRAQKDRARLGVVLDDSNGRLRVSGVTPNSPAAHAGLQAGDEIITVNDYPVSTYDLFVGQIQAMGRAGGQVSIGVRRNGQMLTLHPVLGSDQIPPLPKSELPPTDTKNAPESGVH